MSKLNEENMNDKLKDKLNSLNMDLSGLKTEDKSSIVRAINEIIGKDIISNSIGYPLEATDNWSEMGNKIDNLLNVFKNNMTYIGGNVSSNDTFKTLIDKLVELTIESSEIKYASDQTLFDASTGTSNSSITLSLDFTPSIILIYGIYNAPISGNTTRNYIIYNSNATDKVVWSNFNYRYTSMESNFTNTNGSFVNNNDGTYNIRVPYSETYNPPTIYNYIAIGEQKSQGIVTAIEGNMHYICRDKCNIKITVPSNTGKTIKSYVVDKAPGNYLIGITGDATYSGSGGFSLHAKVNRNGSMISMVSSNYSGGSDKESLEVVVKDTQLGDIIEIIVGNRYSNSDYYSTIEEIDISTKNELNININTESNKKYAEGQSTSSQEAEPFIHAKGSSTSAARYITLPKLGFNPRVILVTSNEPSKVYPNISVISYDESYKCMTVKTSLYYSGSYGSGNTYNFLADDRVFLSDGTIRVPVYHDDITNFKWVAYE